MTGIGGVRMWMEDWLINGSSYDKDYQRNFIKVKNFWNECVKAFKDSKSIKDSNDNYEVYEEKLDALREDIAKSFGDYKKIPLGISDTLDYIEEAIGDLDDRTINRLTENGGKFTTFLPMTYPRDMIQEVKNQYQKVNYHLDFTIKENRIQVSGEFWDVRSFLENNFYRNDYEKAIDEGVFENA